MIYLQQTFLVDKYISTKQNTVTITYKLYLYEPYLMCAILNN